jgi:hypothetical protein
VEEADIVSVIPTRPRRVVTRASALALVLSAALSVSAGTAVAQDGGGDYAAGRDGAGLRWSWVRTPDCPPRSCWQLKVTAAWTSCPHGLYVAVNQWTQADLRSTSNVFLADANAVIPRLQRGQSVVVTLPRTARQAHGASLSEINCY